MWEPESEDESLCVCARLQAYARLWREPLASFSKFRFDLRVTASLLSSESVLSGMNGNRDNRQKAWRADTCCCRLRWFKSSELDGAHNSSWKRNDFNSASHKADAQECQEPLRLWELTSCPLIVTLFIVVVVACSLFGCLLPVCPSYCAITWAQLPSGFFQDAHLLFKALFVFCMLHSCSTPLDFIALTEYKCVYVSASLYDDRFLNTLYCKCFSFKAAQKFRLIISQPLSSFLLLLPFHWTLVCPNYVIFE